MTDTNKQALEALAIMSQHAAVELGMTGTKVLEETIRAAIQPKPSVDVGWLDKLELDLYDDGISADNAQKLIDTVRQGHLKQGWRDDIDFLLDYTKLNNFGQNRLHVQERIKEISERYQPPRSEDE